MMIDADVRALIEVADAACRGGDLVTLSCAVRSLVPRVPRRLQFDAVAIAELAALDEPLACERWRSMMPRLVAALVAYTRGAPVAA